MNPEPDDIIIDLVFEPIKQQFKRDLKKWEKEIVYKSEAGRLGGLKSAETRRKNAAKVNKIKGIEANEAPASNLKQTKQSKANEAVNVNVSVNDTVNENVITKINVQKNQLQLSIESKYPNICKLKKQLTFEEAEKLTNEFSKDAIRNILQAMENYKDLPKKYVSVNLTMRNWLKRELSNGKPVSKSETIMRNAAEIIEKVKDEQ